MPSNQCTNSLMELSFAIGNMIGAEQCDVDDWKQLRNSLASWECSDRGKTGDALEALQGTVNNAIKACDSTGGCRMADCADLFENHEVLIQALNIYDPTQIGRGYRGAIPPKIKGAEGLGRNLGLAEQRKAETDRVKARLAAEVTAKAAESTRRQESTAAATGTTGRYGSNSPARGMAYGEDERRERWYPARV
jgi:hypothetical protein